jgi:hypothetical protein
MINRREYLMLHTTFKLAHESGACTEGYRKLAKHLGGVGKYGKDTPIPLSKIVESNGLADALWTLRCTVEPLEVTEKILIEFACRCAEHVLVNYEKLYPDDKRPREAIEAARAYAEGRGSAAEAAEAAARAAEAAWAAAEAAAWATAEAAEAAARAAEAARAAAWAAAEAAAWATAEDAEAAAWVAEAAAWAAAAAAAWATAEDAEAARAAARAAEQEWQKQTFLELLNQ